MSNFDEKFKLERISSNIKQIIKENKEIIKEINLIFNIIYNNNFVHFGNSTNNTISQQVKDIKIFIEKLVEEISKIKKENINHEKDNKTNQNSHQNITNKNNNRITNDNRNDIEYFDKNNYLLLKNKCEKIENDNNLLNQNIKDLTNENNKLKQYLNSKIEESNFKLINDDKDEEKEKLKNDINNFKEKIIK